MTLQISQTMPCSIGRIQIKNWAMILFITISFFYVVLSDNDDVTAQSTNTADNEFMNNFIGLTNKSGALTSSYQQEVGK